ncbi:hypothetical protein Tco_0406942 [Tanacetum coccineum]
MNEKGVDSSKDQGKESQRRSQEEVKQKVESMRVRRRKVSEKRKTCDKKNDELRLHLTIAPDEEKEVDYEILDRKYHIYEWKNIVVFRTKPQYKAFNDRTMDYDILERKLKETQAVLAQKEHDIKEGLKLKGYEISVVKEKHDALVKRSLLTKSSYEGLVKEKNKVITDLKLKEEIGLDKLIAIEKQLKFLNEIVYKRNQSIQTIHMLAPKGSTFNGRPTFANPMYLKKVQSEKPCLYEILYDTSDLANRFTLDKEDTLTLEQESRLI